MLIYICCAGGATSSLFAQKIQEAGGEQIYIGIVYEALSNIDQYLNDYKLVLLYGPASILSPRFIEEHHLEKQLTSVWVAPQVRFLQNSLQKAMAPYHIDVKTIDMLTFGRMDGKKALQDILRNIKAKSSEE